MRRAGVAAVLLALDARRPAAATYWYNRVPSPDDLWHVIPWFDHMIHAQYIQPYETAARAALHARGHGAGDRRRARLVGRVDHRQDRPRPTRSGIRTRPGGRSAKASPPGPDVAVIPRDVDAAGDTLFQTYCARVPRPGGRRQGTGVLAGSARRRCSPARARGVHATATSTASSATAAASCRATATRCTCPVDRWAIVNHVRKLQATGAAGARAGRRRAPASRPAPSATGSTGERPR